MSERRRRKAAADRRGRKAEWLASLWLRIKGYRVLARRYKTPVGEIDLIVRRGRRLAFVEVKNRADPAATMEIITSAQQQRIRRAAESWLARFGDQGCTEFGFDVVLILPNRLPRQLVDAFPHLTY